VCEAAVPMLFLTDFHRGCSFFPAVADSASLVDFQILCYCRRNLGLLLLPTYCYCAAKVVHFFSTAFRSTTRCAILVDSEKKEHQKEKKFLTIFLPYMYAVLLLSLGSTSSVWLLLVFCCFHGAIHIGLRLVLEPTCPFFHSLPDLDLHRLWPDHIVCFFFGFLFSLFSKNRQNKNKYDT